MTIVVITPKGVYSDRCVTNSLLKYENPKYRQIKDDVYWTIGSKFNADEFIDVLVKTDREVNSIDFISRNSFTVIQYTDGELYYWTKTKNTVNRNKIVFGLTEDVMAYGSGARAFTLVYHKTKNIEKAFKVTAKVVNSCNMNIDYFDLSQKEFTTNVFNH